MATIFERVQLFYSTTNFRFSKTKYKKLSTRIKSHFDSKSIGNQLTYVEVEENQKSFQVRNYPESYTASIDYFIKKSADEITKPITIQYPVKLSKTA